MLNSLKAVCDCSESELLLNSIPVSQNQIQLSRLTSSFKNTNTATAKVLSNRVPPQTIQGDIQVATSIFQTVNGPSMGTPVTPVSI